MPEGVYELGIDIGTASVVAAICRPEPELTGSPTTAFRTSLPDALAAWSARGDLAGASALDPVPAPTDLLDRVGDPTPLRVGDRVAPAADVVAGLVRLLVDHVTLQEGRAPWGTAVVVPPSWGGHRRAALAAALQAAGVEDAVPVSAAVAAVRAIVDCGDLASEATTVVVDLGAATCDIAVVGPGEDGGLAHVVAPPAALAWGGRDVDDAVLRHVRRCLELPAGASSPADRARAVALRGACTAAKEAASLRTDVEVRVDPGWSDTPVRLTREELEAAVADDVERVVATAVDAVAGAGTATEFSAVVLTGGASRMPLVAEYLSDALALPLCAAPDPALTNALGAARLAADRFAPADTAPGNEDRTAPAARRGKARPRREHRPARPGRRSGERAGSPTHGEKAVRPPARVAIVAGLFLLLVVGPSVALTLVGAGPGVATDGTAAAGDKTATDPASTGAGESAAPESTIAGAPRTSNAGHQVVAPSASQTSRNRTSTHRTSSTSTTQARSTSASSKASASPSAPATTAATTAATTSPAASTSTGGTTTGTTTTTNPPTTSAPPPTTTAPPPTTTSDPPPPVVSDPPPVVSSPPAPAPEPPASGGSTGTGTAPGSSDTSTPVSPPATDTTGATA